MVAAMDSNPTPNDSSSKHPEPLRLHLRTRLAELGPDRLAEAVDRLSTLHAAVLSGEVRA